MKPLPEVAETGDRRATLETMRQYLAQAIDDGPHPRDLASLSLRLMAVLSEIDELAGPVKQESKADELRARRAKRQAAS